eukprot:CAMPEP_0179463378 /NCGR_PEP_ID=MMETSP0799-20121207/45468_1 /TAXON_ID=46947 /ORGANISM="Geminigera cryophila, Strain CCMP2564" /LENGTH=413 /DNA_ID=CAMNT_0021266649 /DNA_START=139 /DNA_END=1377 /DNA_ORIENTATION=+
MPIRIFADHHRRAVSQIAPRYLIQHWHFRYNCVFLGGSIFFFAFYCYATLSTPLEGQVSRSWKLLLGYTLLLLLDLLHRSILLIRMHAFLSRFGEGETDELPLEGLRHFDVLSHAASAYFVVACWITHAQFPLRPCEDLDYKLACNALHTISFSFMIWLIITVIVIFVSTSCCCVTSALHRARVESSNANLQRTIEQDAEILSITRALRQTSALPGNQIHNLQGNLLVFQAPMRRRMNLVRALPITQVPPLDGDVCGVCLEEEQTSAQWRLLPCGHRFHTVCVDEWLYRPDGACPTCRKDPTLAIDAGIPPMSTLRGGGVDTLLDVDEDDTAGSVGGWRTGRTSNSLHVSTEDAEMLDFANPPRREGWRDSVVVGRQVDVERDSRWRDRAGGVAEEDESVLDTAGSPIAQARG